MKVENKTNDNGHFIFFSLHNNNKNIFNVEVFHYVFHLISIHNIYKMEKKKILSHLKFLAKTKVPSEKTSSNGHCRNFPILFSL